ncbi:hypothetical protein R1sor_027132 [Riccia sorocarpa]|uniref:Reverse transcriptase domain-containing protein n=1 Tax=Riccia sorocarpa TaxID=122646 RepID=A0ABD3GHK1_9MARC
MEHKMLMKADVLERARKIWQEHLRWARDKRKRWSLALGRIRKLLMNVRYAERRRDEEGGPLEDRVQQARRIVEHDHSAEAKAEFEEEVTSLRQKEHEEADRNRRRCKITWLKEGDAPSKYFFARLKAKHAQEEIATLEINGGHSIEIAYDRVAHGFLWDTLGAMGVGDETVNRIKSLVDGGTSEVHVNGSFTEEIKIGRGVRQGCPLAPLLFAMTTQPLMQALREEERLGNIKGLNLGGGHSLLHQLFADDTSICITAEERHCQFVKLKEVIKEFENASVACLNLQKSVVMQLKLAPILAWLDQAGCEIARPGMSFNT